MQTLKGKVALVTGGSRGLGAATALAFADQGADVAISYAASADKAEALVARLKEKGVRAIAIQADQGNTQEAPILINKVVETFGHLDILVNNAGIAVQGNRVDDAEIDNAAMDRQWAVNALGVVANIRAAVRVLPDGGRIISIGSGLGSRVLFPGTADYAGSKAAIVGYTRGIARDLGPRNITANVIQAGVMDTDMAAASRDKLPEFVKESISIPRMGSVEEVAAAVVYLAGPDSSYITGSTLDIDGGYLA